MAPPALAAWPANGIGEVTVGDDLVDMLLEAWHAAGVTPERGDVVVVTSKVVSKVEGRVVDLPGPDPEAGKDAVVRAETDREVARRGGTRIVRTPHGFVMAAAGVDASNTAPGSLVLLPLDPDASAADLRRGFAERGVEVAVVLSDTSGRAWRAGQTDVALGSAGLRVLDDHAGRVDGYGNPLVVTAPAVADEVAGLADLATGKLAGAPACLVRGLARFVLAAGEPDEGARPLVRPEEGDMFGLGAREAVMAALGPSGSAGARRGFGAPASAGDLMTALGLALAGSAAGVQPVLQGERIVLDPTAAVPGFEAGWAAAVFRAVCHAHGWRLDEETTRRLVASPRL